MKQERARSATMPDPVHFEVGDAVKVKHLGLDMYGTLKWQGNLQDKADMAGIEMVSVINYSLLLGVDGTTYQSCLFTFIEHNHVELDRSMCTTLFPAGWPRIPKLF